MKSETSRISHEQQTMKEKIKVEEYLYMYMQHFKYQSYMGAFLGKLGENQSV